MATLKVLRNRSHVGRAAAVLLAATCAAAGGYAIASAWRRLPSTGSQIRRAQIIDIQPRTLSIAGAAIRGSRNALVAIIEYSDFQCQFCRRFADEILPVLDREYLSAGKATLAFKHLPLEHSHELAGAAAAAAECARQQNRFWQVHDLLFRDVTMLLDNPRSMPDGILDKSQWMACRQSPDTKRMVRADAEEAYSLGIKGTPTFLLGEIRGSTEVSASLKIVGARSADTFRVALDSLMAKPAAVRRRSVQ